jgi:hypothetical protein
LTPKCAVMNNIVGGGRESAQRAAAAPVGAPEPWWRSRVWLSRMRWCKSRMLLRVRVPATVVQAPDQLSTSVQALSCARTTPSTPCQSMVTTARAQRGPSSSVHNSFPWAWRRCTCNTCLFQPPVSRWKSSLPVGKETGTVSLSDTLRLC